MSDRSETHAAPKGHPKGLYVLFFAELWERFSFYGMRALLTLYMTTPGRGAKYVAYAADAIKRGDKPNKPGLGYDKKRAYSIYGAYGSLVYAFPVLGGKLADIWLGYRWAIILGGVLMAVGHFVMAIESELFFFGALALIALGNGFFKPNISSLVGKLYAPGDPRRDSGFTIFYMGINIGAMLAPLICGSLGQYFTWHYGFGLAGVGMLLGLVWFAIGRAKLEGHGEPPQREAFSKLFTITIIGVAALLPLVWFGLYTPQYSTWVLYGVGGLVLAYLLYIAFTSDPTARDRLLLVILLMFFHTLFWSFFEQAGSSLTLFAEGHVHKLVFKTSHFQAINPAFIILLGPVFARLWIKLSGIDKNPSIPMKFSLGLVQLGLGFGVLVLGASFADEVAKTNLTWLVLGYLLHTTGELCLSPVGLSAVTKLAPEKAVGFVMGAWFLSISFAHNVAAIFAGLTSTSDATNAPAHVKLATYSGVFQQMLLIAVTAGVVLAVATPLLKRLTHGVK